MDEGIISLLKQSSIFSGLRTNDLMEFAKTCSKKIFKKNSIILKESARGDTLFIIISGRVKVCRFGDEGKEIILSIMEKGDFFGEISIFDGLERTANVITIKDSEVLLVRRNDLIRLIENNPGIGLGLLRQMSLRFRQTDAQIKSLSILKTTGRVATVLLNLLGPVIEDPEASVKIPNVPSCEDMSHMAGLTRETFSRGLSFFSRMGWILREGSTITIKDWNSLKQMAK